MPQANGLNKSPATFEPNSTLVAVVEMSQSSWLVGGVIPGVDRQPLKKLQPDEHALLELLSRWRDEALKAGCPITRTAVAYEAGRDGFWLARWLLTADIEAHVIHSSSVAVSREHRRAIRGDHAAFDPVVHDMTTDAEALHHLGHSHLIGPLEDRGWNSIAITDPVDHRRGEDLAGGASQVLGIETRGDLAIAQGFCQGA